MFAVRYLALVALVVWVGGLAVLSALVSPATFRVLQAADPTGGRVLADLVLADILQLFHLVAYVCGAIVFTSLWVMKFVGPPPSWFLVRSAIVAIMLALMLYSGYRADEWRARITGGKSVSYTITRKPGRAGRYLTAAWATTPDDVPAIYQDARTAVSGQTGPVVGVDLNDGHLAVRRLDAHGNPVGAPERIDIDLTGPVRPPGCPGPARDHPAHPLHPAARHRHHRRRRPRLRRRPHRGPGNDGPRTARQTLPQNGGRHPDRGVPQPAGRADPADTASRLYAVNPAYTSAWGDQHWRTPYENVTRHEAAATVIGRRAQGHKARRREGVTRTRPEDRVVRATDQATPDNRQATR